MTKVARRLVVSTVAIANGIERVTSGKDWKPYAALADRLLRNVKLEQKCFDFSKTIMQGAPRNWVKAAGYWKDVYSKSVALPQEVLDLGLACGLFEEKAGQIMPAASHLSGFESDWEKKGMHAFFEAKANAEWPFQFFQGQWWEVAVCRYLASQNKYHA